MIKVKYEVCDQSQHVSNIKTLMSEEVDEKYIHLRSVYHNEQECSFNNETSHVNSMFNFVQKLLPCFKIFKTVS